MACHLLAFSMSQSLYLSKNVCLYKDRSKSSLIIETPRTSMAVVFRLPGIVKEVLPPLLMQHTHLLSLIELQAYICPYAQRTWIARNSKALQEKMKLVTLDLQHRPAWYKEKLYPGNKVPALEHKNEVKGESLDLIKFINEKFEGPKLLPDDPAKQQFVEELYSYSDAFNKVYFSAFTCKGDVPNEVVLRTINWKKHLLSSMMNHFSLASSLWFQPFFSEVQNYEITEGRPKLGKWIENKIDAYTATQRDPEELLGALKKKFGIE